MKTISLICISLVLFGCGAQGPLYLSHKIAFFTKQPNEKNSKPILRLSNVPVLEVVCNSLTSYSASHFYNRMALHSQEITKMK